MKDFTVLIPSSNKDDIVETFKAKDFDEAMSKVTEKYPDKTYRLYSGKGVPEKQKANQKVPPTPPAKK